MPLINAGNDRLFSINLDISFTILFLWISEFNNTLSEPLDKIYLASFIVFIRNRYKA